MIAKRARSWLWAARAIALGVLGCAVNVGATWMMAVATGEHVWPALIEDPCAEWPLPQHAPESWLKPTRRGVQVDAVRTDELACNGIEREDGQYVQQQMRVTSVGWPARSMRGVVVMESIDGVGARVTREGAFYEGEWLEGRGDRLLPTRALWPGFAVDSAVVSVLIWIGWIVAAPICRAGLAGVRALRAAASARRRVLWTARACLSAVLAAVVLVGIASVWWPMSYAGKFGSVRVSRGWVDYLSPMPATAGLFVSLPPTPQNALSIGTALQGGVGQVVIPQAPTLQGPGPQRLLVPPGLRTTTVSSRPWWGVRVTNRKMLFPGAAIPPTIRSVELSLWLVGLAAAVPTVVVWIVGWRRDFSRRCPQCGYDLAGLSVGAVCPECGRS